MGWRYRTSSLVNALLGPLGGRLVRRDCPAEWQYHDLRERFADRVRELYSSYANAILPGLPANQRREELMVELVGTGIGEAMWIVDHLHRCLPLEGDVCEFGIAEGATSALMANEILTTQKKLWLFDSFQGLSRPSEKDILRDDIFGLGSMAAYEGRMSYSPDEVKGRLTAVGFPDSRTQIVAGFIEDTIVGPRLPRHVCFAYVDFDLYRPILTALEFLDRVLVVRGCVIVDDYGFFSEGVQKAVDEFVQARSACFQMVLPPPWCGSFAVLQKVAADRQCRGESVGGTRVRGLRDVG